VNVNILKVLSVGYGVALMIDSIEFIVGFTLGCFMVWFIWIVSVAYSFLKKGGLFDG
jgi:hypothetical protein